MKRLLVPCDGSTTSLRAVEHAVGTALESRTPVALTLLHVLDPVTFTSLSAALASDGGNRERPAAVDAALRPAEEIVRTGGVPCEIRWRVGDAASEIVAELREREYAAVIMGTRGVGPLAKLVLGSVASKVQYLIDLPLTFIK